METILILLWALMGWLFRDRKKDDGFERDDLRRDINGGGYSSGWDD